ncbi:MAG: tRNA (adenosine(37)-N6)-threonylcarbamoyltransferase complex ATPase subunit type 1 TsaE [Thermoanaerobaculia bacterium]
MKRWLSKSVEATERVGHELAAALRPDGCLLLYADLGAGKTVLVRGLARGLGIPVDEIQSPTYTLSREHRAGGLELAHLDLYRLSPPEVEAAGVEECLLGPGIKVVEWAERLPFPVPGALEIEIRKLPDGSREIVERDGGSRRPGVPNAG